MRLLCLTFVVALRAASADETPPGACVAADSSPDEVTLLQGARRVGTRAEQNAEDKTALHQIMADSEEDAAAEAEAFELSTYRRRRRDGNSQCRRRRACDGRDVHGPVLGFIKTDSSSGIYWEQGGKKHLVRDCTPCSGSSPCDSYQFVSDSHMAALTLSSNWVCSADVWVELHNAKRADHGACPVVWNEAVAEGMQEWVDGLSSLVHSNSYQLPPPQGPAGENLARGYAGISPEQTVEMWYSEVSDCVSLPGCEHGRNDQAVGHFTAMVWKGVKSIGCAISANGNFAGCRYRSGDSLSGDSANMGGHYVNNVRPAGESPSGC